MGAAAAQEVVTAGLLGAALAYLPFTFLAGRVGAGRVYRAGLLFHVLLALLLFRASSLPAFYLLRFLQGVAAGVVGLDVAERGYVLEHGKVVLQGPASALAQDPRRRT